LRQERNHHGHVSAKHQVLRRKTPRDSHIERNQRQAKIDHIDRYKFRKAKMHILHKFKIWLSSISQSKLSIITISNDINLV
jgi:hypothetical protein